eukprot:TRINITY_DN46370_c0_g1_i1.p1 TRINITY_DN46370_c0_g1~~TRINITY_DN46370_c0_g1_i1.p1  ORF type:complete len:438 (-),score=77.45 TRINITY_DN46370_c0_g1_i1:167-1435(-)
MSTARVQSTVCWVGVLALLVSLPQAGGVLRYPDGSFESRYPLHVDECALPGRQLGSESRACLLRLRKHLLEDADCNRVICDNIETSTPIEVYANFTDWMPFKNLCGHLQELFLGIFDLGVKMVGREVHSEDLQELQRLREVFSASEGVAPPDLPELPAYANTTRSVLRRHAGAALALLEEVVRQSTVPGAGSLLDVAAALARRLQLLIENISVNLLLNFHVAQVEANGRIDGGRDLVTEMYGDVNSVKIMFHEIPGKRWDALTHLLQMLGVSDRSVRMAEIGVEAANTSQRLLERNPSLSYIGIDPYVRNEGLYEDVRQRLSLFIDSGRFTLHRSTSEVASKLEDDESLDIVFLDARHDYEAVSNDMKWWRPKVRPGGILSGHDFSWMFPTVAMAVYKKAFDSPHHERTIHLATDGVWWVQL